MVQGKQFANETLSIVFHQAFHTLTKEMTHDRSSCHLSSGIVSIFDGVILTAIIIVALTGNIITIVAFIRFRTLHTITNFFIASLAAADILVSVLPMPMTFAVYVCSWLPKNQPQNKANTAYLICDMWSSCVSIYSLTTIALDRFFAIKWPFTHQRIVTENLALFAVGVCWVATLPIAMMVIVIKDRSSFTLFIIVVAYAAPVAIMLISYISIALIANQQARKINALEICPKNSVYKDKVPKKISPTESATEDQSSCRENGEEQESDSANNTSKPINAKETLNQNCHKFGTQDFLEKRLSSEIYVNSSSLRTTLPSRTPTIDRIVGIDNPVSAIEADYEVVTENEYHRSEVTISKNMQMRVSSSVVTVPKRTSKVSVAWRRNTLRVRRSLKREFKAAKTLALVMGSFIILWTPFMSINISFFVSPDTELNYSMVKYFKFLHYFNSALNPVLYILLNRQWRAAFREVLCSCKDTRREVDNAGRSDLLGW